MNDLIQTLLGLRSLRWDDPSVHFSLERPLPAWAWVGVGVGALAMALWSYSRMAAPRGWRTSLAIARALLLVLVVLLISGPQLVLRNESVERDWVLVLVDRSASMGVRDVAEAAGAGEGRTTREEQLRRTLESTKGVWSSLAADRQVVWLGFDAGAFDLAVSAVSGGSNARPSIDVDLGEARGGRTLLGPALDQALTRAAARPLSAVVLLTDGRTTSAPDRAVVRRMQADRVPVFAVPLGSEEQAGDIALRRFDAPRLAFVRDITPVRVDLERIGGAGAASARVRLVDKATGLVLDEQTVQWSEGGSPDAGVVLTTRPEDAGGRTWVVQVEPEGPDLVSQNNSAEMSIELVDRPMRVLYIDGYPRWEQRYLRNLLIREPSISCSTLILSTDRRYIQEGDVEIEALPDSPERWAEYDAVMLGDVHPDVFTDDQLAQLREHVSRRGGGLLWVAGPGATPAAWWTTPLADLLPFRKDAVDPAPIPEPVLMHPTDAALRLGVLRLGEEVSEGWPADLADAGKGWSLLRWAQMVDRARLKPAAEVLADLGPQDAPADQRSPGVIAMRYGAGRVLYVATDEIWRWRYARGEVLPERFWLQMIRLLGRESLARAGRPAVIEIAPRRAEVDQPVRISVELIDQALIDLRPPSLAVRVTRRAQPGEPEGPALSVELVLKPEREDGRVYSAIWLPPEPGVWRAEPIDPILTGLSLFAEGAVLLPDDEMRRPETDHALLARLCEETGGAVITPASLTSLPERLPNRRIRLLHETAESLWDTPLALTCVLLLLTLEWIGRRVIRLI